MRRVQSNDGTSVRPGGKGLARLALLALLTAATAAIFSPQLWRLYHLSLDSELYSHIVLIPAISAYVIYMRHRRLSAVPASISAAGLPVLLSGALLFMAADGWTALSAPERLAASVLAALVVWAGCFISLFGPARTRAAMFPLLFLLFMVPVPAAALDYVVVALQKGSAEVAWLLFSATGAPVYRDGLFFHLPGLTIEVAKECSGIRSSIALFVSGTVASNLFLRSWPARAALIASLAPIAVLKNGVRITSLSLAGYHIDERMLYGSLHTRGGIPFFLLALAMTGVVLWVLMLAERKLRGRKAGAPP